MAAVGTKSDVIMPLEVAKLCTTHCVCVQISDEETELYVVSQYFPPTENIKVGILSKQAGQSTGESQRQEDHHWLRCKCEITAVVQQEHRRQR